MILRPYILHPEWLGSDRVVALRDHLKLFFLKIGNVTDGAGRFEADAALLRAALYPKELHKVSERDVRGMMEQLHLADLIRLYTRAGKGFGEVTIYKQTDSMRKVRFPGPDSGELNFAAGSDGGEAAPPRDRLRKNKPIRSEEKIRDVCVEAPPAPTTHDTYVGSLSQEEWLVSLRAQWPKVNIAEEMLKAGAYVRRERGPSARLTRKFFVKSWLPGCTGDGDEVVLTRPKAPVVTAVEPAGWREGLKGSVLGDRVTEEGLAWGDLNAGQQEFARAQVAELRRVSA